MTNKPVEMDPMTVSVVEDDVVVLGPGPVGLSMTGKAARESARRLREAARAVSGGGEDAEPERGSGGSPD